MADAATNVWAELERRRRVMWVTAALVVFPAASFLVLPPLVPMVLLAAWAVALVVTSEQVTSYPCPRCTKPLYREGLFHNQLTKTCLHCGQVIGGEAGQESS